MGKPRPGSKTGRWAVRWAGRGGRRPPVWSLNFQRGRIDRRRAYRFPEGHRVGRQKAQGAVRAIPGGPAEREVPVESLIGADLDRFDLVEVGRHGLDRHPLVVLPGTVDAWNLPDVGLGLPRAGLSDHRHDGAASTIVLDLKAGPDHALFPVRGALENVAILLQSVGVPRPGSQDLGIPCRSHLRDEGSFPEDPGLVGDPSGCLRRHDRDAHRRQTDFLGRVLGAVGQELHRVAESRHEGAGVVGHGIGFTVGAEGFSVRRGRPFEGGGVVIAPPWPRVLRRWCGQQPTVSGPHGQLRLRGIHRVVQAGAATGLHFDRRSLAAPRQSEGNGLLGHRLPDPGQQGFLRHASDGSEDDGALPVHHASFRRPRSRFR